MSRDHERERDRDRDRSRRSRSRSRERDSRRRSHSHERHRDADRDRDRERERERERDREREWERDRERDRGRDSDRRYQGAGPASAASSAYPPHRAAPAWQPAAPRFHDPRSSSTSAAPASYGHTHSTSASAAASTPSATGPNEFVRFQQALELHNAARQQPAQVSKGGVEEAPGKKLALAELEELARKKLAEEKASAAQLKPVFLTKAQRQAAALAKLAERQADMQAQAAKRDEHMRQFLQDASREKQAARESAAQAARQAAADRDRKREEDARRRAAGGAGGSNPTLSVHANNLQLEKELEQGRQRELELIRNHYLGVKDPSLKKQHIPSSQKFKFHFDWNAKDDTGVDTNALYKHRHHAAAMYGRGFTGGVDRKEQRKKHSFYEELVQHRLASGHVGNAEQLDAELMAAVKDEPIKLEDAEAAAAAASIAAAARAEKALAREEREMRRAREQELKNRHWSEKALEEMEERDWRIFKEDFSISTRGSNIPHPLRYWKEAKGLPDSLMRALEQAGYKDPTPIQRAAIPIGLQCRDVIGIAETGSGKTCAFLVPMLVYISKLPPITVATAGEGPYALIMAPTRELAQQISAECDKFSKYMNIKNVCVVGGLSIEEQGFKIREGAEVVIGTPGRLFDVIQKRYMALNVCNYIVLDEADRMIDIGFEAQIQAVMDQMPSSNLRPEGEDGLVEGEDEAHAMLRAQGMQMDDGAAAAAGANGSGPRVYRQTIMFSATMPPRVEALAKKYLRHAVFISVGDRQKGASRVEQRVLWLDSEGQKKKKLLELASQSELPLIVFSNLKKNVDSICKWLAEINLGSVALHGSKSQDDRMAALAAFKAGQVPVLVATDVAGRGLDVHGVKHVINYDMPDDVEKYTHRIGRTGRAGHSGLATSFLLETDEAIFYDLANMLRASNQPVPPQLAQHDASKHKPGTVSESGPPKPKVQFSKR